MKLSIIIPVFNGEKYIHRCISSIEHQTFSDYEIIIVDDGSTDSSGLICNELSLLYENIKVIHKKNGGVSSARNAGIKLAEGTMVTFIDIDDILLKDNYLEQLMEYSNYDYIVSGFTYIGGDESNHTENVYKYSLSKGNSLIEFPDTFFINGVFHTVWGKVYKKSIIDEFNISFKSFRISEDSLFNIDYVKEVSNWVITPLIGYGYINYHKKENATGIFRLTDIDSYVFLHREMINVGLSEKLVRRTLYPQYYNVCKKYYSMFKGSKEESRKACKYLFKDRLVLNTLLFTVTDLKEWVVGLLLLIRLFIILL